MLIESSIYKIRIKLQQVFSDHILRTPPAAFFQPSIPAHDVQLAVGHEDALGSHVLHPA